MYDLSDILLWRSLFVFAMIAALLLGVGAWKLAGLIGKRMQLMRARRRFVLSAPLRQARP